MTWLILAAEPEAAQIRASIGDRFRVENPSNLAETVREAWTSGARRFALWGDDPLVHEVVSVLLPLVDADREPLSGVRAADPFAAEAPAPVAALVPLGPNGLARTLGLKARPEQMQRHLSGALFGPLDVCWFASETERVAMCVSARGVRQRGAVTLTADERTLNGLRPADSIPVERARVLLANGQFVGTRRLAPRAVPHDGAIDVVVPQRGGWRLRSAFGRLERGDRVDRAVLVQRLVERGRLEGDIEIELDGCARIRGPLTFTVETTRLALGV